MKMDLEALTKNFGWVSISLKFYVHDVAMALKE